MEEEFDTSQGTKILVDMIHEIDSTSCWVDDSNGVDIYCFFCHNSIKNGHKENCIYIRSKIFVEQFKKETY